MGDKQDTLQFFQQEPSTFISSPIILIHKNT